jgi:hypothetical protein
MLPKEFINYFSVIVLIVKGIHPYCCPLCKMIFSLLNSSNLILQFFSSQDYFLSIFPLYIHYLLFLSSLQIVDKCFFLGFLIKLTYKYLIYCIKIILFVLFNQFILDLNYMFLLFYYQNLLFIFNLIILFKLILNLKIFYYLFSIILFSFYGSFYMIY